jgi:hypothetical protein
MHISDGVLPVSVTLRVGLNVVDVVQEGRALAHTQSLRASVVSELPEKDRTAEFLAISTIVGSDDVRAKSDRVARVHHGNHIVDFVLAIQQQRSLGRSLPELPAG